MNGRMLRHYDSESPIHQLWAGTKVLWLPAVGTTIAFQVSWIAIGLGWAAALVIFVLPGYRSVYCRDLRSSS